MLAFVYVFVIACGNTNADVFVCMIGFFNDALVCNLVFILHGACMHVHMHVGVCVGLCSAAAETEQHRS